MKYFLKIEFLSIDNSNRTIEQLSKYYNEKSLLKEKIRKVGVGFLDNENLIRGKKILLKPNWVLDDRKVDDKLCLRTNDSFLLSAIEIIIEQRPSQIVIGDAPIQGCNWDKLINRNFLLEIENLSKTNNIPVIIRDFRRVTYNPELNNLDEERSHLSEYLIFDIGKVSSLEPISTKKNNFRVTNYNPDRLAESHRKGVHKYCITKDFFDADVIISIPKVKTHQKVGITCGLKNLVGINGDKDFLPHHRIGGTGFGGDCYPGKNIIRLLSEYILDIANRRRGKWTYKLFKYLAIILWKLTNPKIIHHLAAGWYGNDTTWRMVMDLNKIAVYGKSDGTISDKPQRILYSLSDGIIGGQGDGPLNPKPLPLGIISFTNHSGLNDICMATLMGFNYRKLPLLSNLNIDFSSPEYKIIFNGEKISFEELKKHTINTQPPPGWEIILQ